MKKILKKSFSLLLVLSVILTSSFISGYAAENSVEIETITFGSYPQSKVTDEALIENLNNLPLKWESYNYYSGTGVYDDGQMKSSDYMRYADVEYNSEKYRAVIFDTYRPTFTGYKSTADAETYQDNNGYYCNTVYWFKYEPLEWRVLDAETGYVICESIIDSQPFSNFIYFNGTAYYMDDKGWDYTNYYVNSSLRNWLNTDFSDTAFNELEKEKIALNYMDFWVDIEDKIFIPSADEMRNTDWWKDDASRVAYGTDYAECQGLFTEEGSAYWRLRNIADWSQYDCAVSTDGTLYSYDYYYRAYPFQTAFTGTGIRPAIKLGKLSDKSFEITKRDVSVPEIKSEDIMTFVEKVSAFFSGIKSIAKYYFSSVDSSNKEALAVMDSLSKGINVPCMQEGWAREWILEKSTFENIKNKGFDYIRLPANLVCMLDGNGIFNESAANNLDRALKYATDTGLKVILDLHGWEVLNEDPSAENIETLCSVWKQVAERYKDFPAELMFQIYNEPNNSSGKMSDARWNYIQNKVTAAIREIDKDRIIVLSSKNYNVSSSLSDMCYNRKDSYIIIDVHNYAPMEFTHQGAEWVEGLDEKVAYSEDTKNAFADAIKTAVDFRNKYGTKIIIGEFGAYLKQTEKSDVTAFLKDAVTVMEENDLPWAYWEYDAGFGAYDCNTKQWKDYVTDGLMTE